MKWYAAPSQEFRKNDQDPDVPVPTDRSHEPEISTRTEIDAFLKKVCGLEVARPLGQRGRLFYALDATASRSRPGDLAYELQADMFVEAAKLGGLDIQSVYYRGSGECCASRFTFSPR